MTFFRLVSSLSNHSTWGAIGKPSEVPGAARADEV